MTLTIDVSQQVIQAPRFGVCSHAGVQQCGSVIRTYFRKKHRAVFVGSDELGIEGGAHAQQRRQQMKIEIAEAKTLSMCIFKSNDFAAYVLQGTHPVPIRGETGESKG